MDICEEIFTDSTVYILHANLSSHFISSQLKIILAEPLLVHLIYIYQTNSQISQCLDTFSVIVLQIWFTLHKIALTNNSRFSLPFNSLNNNASLLHLLSASCLASVHFLSQITQDAFIFLFFLFSFFFFTLNLGASAVYWKWITAELRRMKRLLLRPYWLRTRTP